MRGHIRAFVGATLLAGELSHPALEPCPTLFAASLLDPSLNQGSYYANSSWPALHRDSSNSDFVPFVSAKMKRVSWTALDGAAVIVPPAIGPEGNVYVTTGQGPGTSHLHAFDRHGNSLWKSPPQQSTADLDSGAVGNAPAIDIAGDIYVGDSDQVWAFHSDGALKWVVNLPESGFPFVSSVITKEGFVGGITTDGKVVLLNRADGTPVAPILDLPGGRGPAGPPVPPGLWAGGLMDPTIIARTYHALLGFGAEITNTPAIHPTSGRIYITAAGADRNEGILYGIDLHEGAWTIAIQAPMAAGSGTSPAISPDGRQVYAVGGDHVMAAFDSDTGEILWRASNAGSAASPAIAPDGTVFSGERQFLQAIDPSNGTAIWRQDLLPLAQEYLPRRSGRNRPSLGIPIAYVNSVVTITPLDLLVGVVIGYQVNIPGYGVTYPQPRYTVLCTVDRADGHILSSTAVRDTSEAIISTGADGRVYFPHAAMLSSIAFYGLNPQLPMRMRTDGPPLAGLTVLEPASYVDQVSSGVAWVQELCLSALQRMSDSRLAEAQVILAVGRRQLAASIDSATSDLMESREISHMRADAARFLLAASDARLEMAEDFMLSNLSLARAQINLAMDFLDNALGLLHNRLTVQLDVLPGSCPNYVDMHPSPKDSIDVAIVGAPGFDVSRIDGSSVTLVRADGYGGSVRPITSDRGISGGIQDVSSPVGGAACACESRGADRIDDYVLSFSAQQLVDALQLGTVNPEGFIILRISGFLVDNTPFHATDCVIPVRRSLGGKQAPSSP